MINIELLWKEYLAFEQSINVMIADKMMIERSRDYMNARRVTKEYEVVIRGLNKNYPSIPPTGGLEEMKQVILPRYDIFMYILITIYFFRWNYGKNISFGRSQIL